LWNRQQQREQVTSEWSSDSMMSAKGTATLPRVAIIYTGVPHGQGEPL